MTTTPEGKAMTPDEALEIVKNPAVHDVSCIRARWEAGRPTADGGYEQKFGGNWYRVWPVDHTPKCECGLAKALAVLDGLHAHFSRFKAGDVVWSVIIDHPYCHGRVTFVSFDVNGIEHLSVLGATHILASNCFPAKAEAQAECDRRNKAK